ncbi:Holliday junction branch migration protein RuvA [Homoserinibacter sp. YIM 151385]|uniref:Holliday junction branch migration protein RuvA n=1 Tax=Homoserinibacter sp. YIM 151385 TaxID=2985506 RepID=UPI0022F10D46|nr:Holliday junction branch migration protein RuvA [Homoserinibacter sp. YIM 151385]WBU38681.1 Holliday junction branch migration protein RuvA [Homoserinibacter sp. YIM 151385]
MISSVRGTVLSSLGSSVVVEVGGVGLRIAVTPQHALGLRQGAEAVLHTALIVREDDLSLFGFATPEELAVFDLLRGVTGVGPKSALGVLAELSPEAVAAAVAGEDDAAFRRVSGIGPKTAKLITVSLAGKLVVSRSAAAAGGAGAAPVADEAVVEALIGLGWAEKPARAAVGEVVERAGDADRVSVPALLRLALAELGPAPRSAR